MVVNDNYNMCVNKTSVNSRTGGKLSPMWVLADLFQSDASYVPLVKL